MTWKVAEGCLQHIDVKEEGKENAFSLGNTLLINGEVSNSSNDLSTWQSIRSASVFAKASVVKG